MEVAQSTLLPLAHQPYEVGMTVNLDKKYAYVDLGDGQLLKIGTRKEVENASQDVLGEMILHALAISLYESISNTMRWTVQ